MYDLALFAGGGGSLLAAKLLGWRTVCAVELDPYCRHVLLARQRDGFLSRFPIWDDVRTFDGKCWRGYVDIITGGFPCQDISNAGPRVGISGPRSGLWAEFARILGEVRPRYAFIENTAALAHRGLDRVLADLAALGMDARWCSLGADDVGAPHIRKRLWILAYALCPQRWADNVACETGRPQLVSQRQEGAAGAGASGENVADAPSHLWRASREEGREASDRSSAKKRTGWWTVEPPVGRVVNGVAHRVDCLRALGNGWVPQCAVAAWQILSEGLS